MRTLALLLLLTNLAFLAWQQQFLPWLPWQPELLQPEPAQPYHSTLPKLVLLSEREAATRTHSQIVPPAPVEKTQAETEHLVKEESPVKVEEKPPVPPPAPISPALAQPVAEVKSPAPVPEATTSEKAAPAESTPPQPQTESVSFQKLAMRLISQGQIHVPAQVAPIKPVAAVPPPKVPEIATIAVPPPAPVAETPQPTEPAQKNEPPPPVHEAKPISTPPVATNPAEKDKTLLSVPPTKINKTEVVCYQIGHFLQLGEAQAASNWFKKKQITATTQKSDTRLATTTWLYLPAVRSLQSAQATQQRLKQLGIADTVVIRNPNGHIVSLGVYRDKTSISKRLQELRSKGFDTIQTEERYATETKYWLNVKIVANATTLLSQFQKAFKGLQAGTMNCDDLR